MENAWAAVAVSGALLLGNAFFVAAEYGLVGARRSRIDALAKRGNRNAKLLQTIYANFTAYVAGIQVAITMFGIGIGAITEEQLRKAITRTVPNLPPFASSIVSILIVTYIVVVLGEILPKYLALAHPDKVALSIARPTHFLVLAFKPLVWVVQSTGNLALRLIGLNMDSLRTESVSKEELGLLVKAGGGDVLEEDHAHMVAKALRLDVLDVADVMVHRLDIQWIDASIPTVELLDRLSTLRHSRFPVCRDDIDDVIGIGYLQDVLSHRNEDGFELAKILRPVEAVPENLSLARAINRMRDAKTQILIVMDEYGGTSGLITLEDIIEEVFGELEDQPESGRPPIERLGTHRISARADVRYDELLEFLGLETDEQTSTETLATLVIEHVERVPRVGDIVDLPIGRLRVENMARRRITRVWIQLSREASPADS